MNKQLQITSIIMLIMVLVVSCAPKPTPTPTVPPAVEEPKVAIPTVPKEVPTTGEASVDEVATDISDASDTDDELDTSELDDVDNILADIENI